MRFKILSVVLSGMLLASAIVPAAGAASILAKGQNSSVSENHAINCTEREVRTYNKKFYPTRSSIPQVYHYNDGKYAGQLNITTVISYGDGVGEWWGVTYEGPVYPVYRIYPV
ncbi:PAS sensor protein [Paenibacillus apiarius]|uniref:PAS sensor protein n=1 Tax=Paenibacillus apiarius TaxID=46240 RepID=A0ABT4DTY7_9BACL|nr:PAS sensor protein [Paenibacillus apiarius]MCY9515898.1 PAS sensor protein [Paenibacillus apiarius]MCY9520808.1 PAS sensor protein [Paenibacillus apiarius]MCY9553513.1 PAS sensor protein [Paenibacillus apiarius]MCY9557964.1 PAS sensor protein [Paenibacillus apiarius]MCY9685819.1 PAS sensor protein [Paenibacillus apiarius]